MSSSRITPITSADNAQFKELKKLAASARERRKTGRTLLDGVHLLMALADAGGQVELIILRVGSESAPQITQCLARFPTVPAIVLPPKLFDALSPVETPVGILGLMAIPHSPEQSYRCAVLMEDIQDPGNLGGILRTAAAAGVNAVYLSTGCAEAWSPKALRAGMGAQFVIAIHEHQALAHAAGRFDCIMATTLHGGDSVFDLDLRGSVAFVFGNEGAGLSEELTRRATHLARIPMPGRVESLNVAAAAAVCLFERVRQLTHRRIAE